MTARPLGWRAPEELGRAPHRGVRTAAAGLAGLPKRIDLGALPGVYDQGSVGSCTAQALAGAIETLAARSYYRPERPDRPALYRRERDAIGYPDEDSGAILADGIAALRRGWEPEAEHPTAWGPSWLRAAPRLDTNAPRLVSAEPLDYDPASIAWELACGHPVAVGLRITDQWDRPGTTLDAPAGPSTGGHAVLLVGYDVPARLWRVRNSWGADWGDGGYVWLPWSWTAAPWCGEAWSLRAIRRADAPALGGV